MPIRRKVVEEAVRLRREEGMSYREIGRVLHVPFTSLIPYLKGVKRGRKKEERSPPNEAEMVKARATMKKELMRELREELLEELKEEIRTEIRAEFASMKGPGISPWGGLSQQKETTDRIVALEAKVEAHCKDARNAFNIGGERLARIEGWVNALVAAKLSQR